ncbi:META domain-containing protein [Flavilitoribacter nigricans]|uniref:Heat-shock protein HslJ n=1 Tax=Flavilitoribacter nigricans (strain ATCC 23147 / DSM 23189 / NBRC 102662 / NCIMB 1420 / SS-2) TaxID=1122177 RepID=A0A2D0N1L0_FLAN2|nr:META domain-containing protein [Flavilitoribacter nigricans]PHN02347.1 heat-shock protein HslJ [Flavilitoribacter nigricans DSM 23189 = NBRC 102662]
MNFKIIFSSLMALILLQSCATTKKVADDTTTFWVAGYKTEASAGAGKMQVLNIHRGETLDNPQWEHFYANIEGFQFEEGYLQKIEVKAEKLDKSQVPADASSIKYTLVKVLDKQKDIRTVLNGEWTLMRLNDRPLNRMVVLPTMTIDLSQNLVAGNGGCNTFNGKIQELSASKIKLGPVVSTRKACMNKNVESEFNQALNTINTYQIAGNNLTFYDDSGKKVLAFIKNAGATSMDELNTSWTAARINGNPIDRMTPLPKMTLDLNAMQVSGNDSCNDFSGKIESVTASGLQFGTIAATQKMCRNMETADRFGKALDKTGTYKLDDTMLTLYDKYGNELLAFLKAN